MKYMLLIYGNHEGWGSMTQESFAALMAAHTSLQDELRASGEFIDTNELPIENSKIVRKQAGVPIVTDGPFVEVKEILAGYYLVDCESVERAAEIAMRLAEAEFGLVEVRQVSAQPDH